MLFILWSVPSMLACFYDLGMMFFFNTFIFCFYQTFTLVGKKLLCLEFIKISMLCYGAKNY